MFTLVLLLVVLASIRGSFRAGIPATKDTSLLVGRYIPPCRSNSLDVYWYAYQETGDLHTLAATLLNVGEII
jgi:hypothetical protein